MSCQPAAGSKLKAQTALIWMYQPRPAHMPEHVHDKKEKEKKHTKRSKKLWKRHRRKSYDADQKHARAQSCAAYLTFKPTTCDRPALCKTDAEAEAVCFTNSAVPGAPSSSSLVSFPSAPG